MIIKYIHHDAEVSVQEHLKGKHREHCLCFQGCARFKPGTSNNCPIAAALFDLCLTFDLATPMWEWECPDYLGAS